MLETLLQPGDRLERCGLILKDGSIVELPNVHPEPEKGFEMDPAALLPHVKSGELAGSWHTHPDADPNLSGEDYSLFLSWPDLVHCIVGLENGAVVVRKFKVENGVVLSCD